MFINQYKYYNKIVKCIITVWKICSLLRVSEALETIELACFVSLIALHWITCRAQASKGDIQSETGSRSGRAIPDSVSQSESCINMYTLMI